MNLADGAARENAPAFMYTVYTTGEERRDGRTFMLTPEGALS